MKSHLMQKVSVSGALQLLINNMSNGILSSTDETLYLLHTKHPEMQNSHELVLLQGPIKQFHPIVYKAIDVTLISKAALKIKDGFLIWKKNIIRKLKKTKTFIKKWSKMLQLGNFMN